MNWKPISLTEGLLYRGLAILMIAAHNFCHHVKELPGENEFGFKASRFRDFIHLWISDPLDGIRNTMHFMGHYGVQVFLFLSAYGLSVKYAKTSPAWWPFVKVRIGKLYPTFILAIAAWLLYQGWFLGGPEAMLSMLQKHWVGLITKLTFTSSFFQQYAFSPVGPWWFLSLIAQFYVIYPFLLSFYQKRGDKGLLKLTLVAYLITYCWPHQYFNLFYTVIPHMPEFCLGVYLAGKSELKIKASWLWASAAVYLAGNLFIFLWYPSVLASLILMLALFQWISRQLKSSSPIRKVLAYIGAISMPLFFVNGFMRYPIIGWAKEEQIWWYTLATCGLFLITSIIMASLLYWLEMRFSKWRQARKQARQLES